MAKRGSIESEAPALDVHEATSSITDADAPTLSPDVVAFETTITRELEPRLAPPTETSAEATGEGITAWHNDKKIVALWSNSSPRNAFISVPGMGWKKLANTNDSSFVNMTMLASHAEQTGANVNLRVEADEMVHEIYVW